MIKRQRWWGSNRLDYLMRVNGESKSGKMNGHDEKQEDELQKHICDVGEWIGRRVLGTFGLRFESEHSTNMPLRLIML